MISLLVVATIVVIGIIGFIVTMNRHGEKLVGDEEEPSMIWADEDWYKEDGPPDG
ncbi:hypothetical protein [Exiguobacterium qingdaonense]|uniref:hypothetical protein n=1 Tax=Exiguobacterium qingdaonense TaxID=2751251 RepID=UPI001BE7532F|nr:hypothetical protein [Exiguobacterium qingdaonense]